MIVGGYIAQEEDLVFFPIPLNLYEIVSLKISAVISDTASAIRSVRADFCLWKICCVLGLSDPLHKVFSYVPLSIG